MVSADPLDMFMGDVVHETHALAERASILKRHAVDIAGNFVGEAPFEYSPGENARLIEMRAEFETLMATAQDALSSAFTSVRSAREMADRLTNEAIRREHDRRNIPQGHA